MGKKKKVLIIISVLIFIIILILIVLRILKNKEKQIEYMKEENPELSIRIGIEKVEDESEFFVIQNCINDYFLSISNKETDKTLDKLNRKYIEKNSVTTNNILNYNYEITEGYEAFIPDEMYNKEVTIGDVYQYYVFGKVISSDTEIKNVYIIVDLDYNNNSFSIIPSDEKGVSKEDFINIINNLKSSDSKEYKYVNNYEVNEISGNNNNKFSKTNVQGSDLLYYYLKNFGLIMVYDTENSYDYLDEEYREKRFGSIAEYKKYVDRKKYELTNAVVLSYDVDEYDDYKEYRITDNNKNNYVFRIKGFMNYEVLLDYYTIDIPQIANVYDESNDQDKASFNVQKIAAAINEKDFKYIYNKLAQSFKDNKFNTYEEFEEYMTNIFIGKLNMKVKKYNNEGETFIYDLEFAGTTASNNRTINMQVIMKLKENRDFVMSFSIK